MEKLSASLRDHGRAQAIGVCRAEGDSYNAKKNEPRMKLVNTERFKRAKPLTEPRGLIRVSSEWEDDATMNKWPQLPKNLSKDSPCWFYPNLIRRRSNPKNRYL